jgi:hypothetical protein
MGDACCVSRLTDDRSQQRIRVEAESIEAILGNVRQGKIAWIVSPVLTKEIQRCPQIERRRENGARLALATHTIEVSDLVLIRARQLEAAGRWIWGASSGQRRGRTFTCPTDNG